MALAHGFGEARVVSAEGSRVEFDFRLDGDVAVSTVDGRGNLLAFDRER